MCTPFITAINGVSGGGKTTVATALHRSLPSSVLLAFDTFKTTKFPADMEKWLQRGGSLSEFDFPQLRDAITEQITNHSVNHLVLDYPFGRSHPSLKVEINLSVFVDTPLDVAMARRVMRDIATNTEIPDADIRMHLHGQMAPYSERLRRLYVHHVKMYREDSDLIVDGCKPVTEIVAEINTKIAATHKAAQQLTRAGG